MSERFRLESYLDHIPQHPNYHSTIKWYNGKVGEISDVENVNVYRFYEGNYDHTVEISQGKEFPAVFGGISAYWIKYRKRKTVKLELYRHFSLAIGPIIEKDTPEIFEEYTGRRYEELHDEYMSHPDNWDWDWDFVFFVKTIIWKELVLNSAVKVAMKGFLPPEEEELVCKLMDNYIKYLKKQRKAKGYEVSSEYLVLRGVQDEKSECYFEDLDRATIISTLDALEAKGYVKVAWVEGHDFEDAMILPKGKERLRELEEQIQSHQADAKFEPQKEETPETPKRTPAAECFVKEVDLYRFMELEKVKVLNQSQQTKLIELIVDNYCRAAAFLKYLGYADKLENEYKLKQRQIISHCAQALQCKESTYKKYYLSTRVPFDEEMRPSYEKHNARTYLETGTLGQQSGIEKLYQSILQG